MELKKIMTIDDDETSQFIAKTIINRFDPEVQILQAFDGEEALEILRSEEKQPDVIFLDINMPIMDGHEFLEKYNQQEDKTEIIFMLTSSNDKVDREKSKGYDFVHEYIPKPFCLQVLEQLKER